MRAALEAPAWIASHRLAQLLESNGSQPTSASSTSSASSDAASSDAASSASQARLAVPCAATEPVLASATADALRVAFSALRVLARLRRLGGPWRNTCLYRSVAGCLVLRRHGSVATLRLGARASRAETGASVTGMGSSTDVSAAAPGHVGVSAHAWVEDACGRPLVESPDGHTPLRPYG
jgi:hypothetical protein